MRRFLLAAGLALLLHALLFSAKAKWLKKDEVQWTRPEPITLALIYHQPPKPLPKPPEKIVSPEPKTIIRQKSPPEKKVAPPPPPPTKPPMLPEKREPEPEPEEARTEEPKPIPVPEIPIQESIESVTEAVEPEEEEAVETVSVPDIQSIDAHIVEDMGDEAPFPAALESGPLIPEPAPLQMAVPAYREQPSYPRLAKRRGYEGTVVLKVLVGIDGRVVDLEILESSGHDILDRSAEKSVRKWLFEPWKKGDESIEMWGQVIVRFQLN